MRVIKEIRFAFEIFFGCAICMLFIGKINCNPIPVQDTVLVNGDIFPSSGNLNRAIGKAIDEGVLSVTVFKLNLNSRYYLDTTIVVPSGEILQIIAPEPGRGENKAPPQILSWVSTLSKLSKSI